MLSAHIEADRSDVLLYTLALFSLRTVSHLASAEKRNRPKVHLYIFIGGSFWCAALRISVMFCDSSGMLLQLVIYKPVLLLLIMA